MVVAVILGLVLAVIVYWVLAHIVPQWIAGLIGVLVFVASVFGTGNTT